MCCLIWHTHNVALSHVYLVTLFTATSISLPSMSFLASSPLTYVPSSPPVCPLASSMPPTRWITPDSCHSCDQLRCGAAGCCLWRASGPLQSSCLLVYLHTQWSDKHRMVHWTCVPIQQGEREKERVRGREWERERVRERERGEGREGERGGREGAHIGSVCKYTRPL